MPQLPKIMLGLLSLGYLIGSRAEEIALYVDFINSSSQTTIMSLWPKTEIISTLPAHTIVHYATTLTLKTRGALFNVIQKMIVWENGQWSCTVDLPVQVVENALIPETPLTLIKTEIGCHVQGSQFLSNII